MLTIEPELREQCPHPKAIQSYLKGQGLPIISVTSTTTVFHSKRAVPLPHPTLEFRFEGNGADIEAALRKARYVILKAESGVILTLAFKRKLLRVEKGTFFSVPDEFNPESGITGREGADRAAGAAKSPKKWASLLKSGHRYAILGLDANGRLTVIDVTEHPEAFNAWLKDQFVGMNQKEVLTLGYWDMFWIYRTALLNI